MPHAIIERIEDKRIMLDMTVKQLSERSGVPESTYCNMVAGRSQNPSFDRILALAVAVDISPMEFMGKEESKEVTQEPESLESFATRQVSHYDLAYFADALIRTARDQAADFRAATASRNELFNKAIAELNYQFERERASYQAQLAAKEKWLHRAAVLLVILIAFIMTILLVDIFNPAVGWFRTAVSRLFARAV